MRSWVWAALLLPAVLLAQGPRPGLRRGPALWEGAWWNSPIARNLNLSAAQRKDIRVTVREYRSHLLDLREAVQRADGDLETALGENPLDQRKANEAIEHLAMARGDLTRTLSQMTLRLRMILTNEQWQELQRRQAGRRAGPGNGVR
ncbi:MAG: periplasmic heavy metal sensor [Acidobacteriota bacterium]